MDFVYDNKYSGKYNFFGMECDYIGEFKDGKPNGYGKITCPDDKLGTYDGEFKDGRPYGYGNIKNKYYDGEVLNGIPNGLGKMFFENNNLYEGEIKDGKIKGQGTMTYSSGEIYSGEFDKDKLKNGTIKLVDNTIKNVLNYEIISLSNKPEELISVRIKNQGKFGTCWAHTVSRNFVRTLQILDVVKSKYAEQFYDLFYTILTENRDCDEGYNETSMFYLLDNLKNNYRKSIFEITYNKTNCIDNFCEFSRLDKIILEGMEPNDKQQFISDFEYFIDNNLLFLGKYVYVVKPNDINKPTLAIKTMLYYRLQPFVGIEINNYFNKMTKNLTNNFPSIPITNNFDNNCVLDKKGKISSAHAVNLRKWKTNGIEFKNSHGTFFSNDGNFSVSDLSYLVCKKLDGEYINDIQFASLMFDYENLTTKYKNRVNEKLCSYWKTFDNLLKTEESKNYTGEYNKYGLFDGFGKIIYSDSKTYLGNWKNGFRNGHGTMIWTNGRKYEGNWENDKQTGFGTMTWSDGREYEGNWKDNIQNGQGKMRYSNGNEYSGNWNNGIMIEGSVKIKFDFGSYIGQYKNGYPNGLGTIIYSNGDTYKGEFLNSYKNGKGIMIYSNGDKYDGEWKLNKKVGQGEMIYSNGDKYSGNWRYDEKDGQGMMIYSNGDKYDGEWSVGDKDGEGTMIYSNGNKYSGEWMNNKKKGQGIMIYSNGEKYSGLWKNDIPANEDSSEFKQKYLKYKKKYLGLKILVNRNNKKNINF